MRGDKCVNDRMSATWKAAIEQEYVEASLPFVLLNLLIGGGTSASSSSSSEKKPKSGGEGEKKKKNAEASGSEDASGSKGKVPHSLFTGTSSEMCVITILLVSEHVDSIPNPGFVKQEVGKRGAQAIGRG